MRRRLRLTHVLMTLHAEPEYLTYRYVPRWRRRRYARGGWCRWPESRLNPERGPVPTIKEKRA
jgi:hypothetical protein